MIIKLGSILLMMQVILVTGCFFQKPLPNPVAPQVEEYTVAPDDAMFNNPPRSEYKAKPQEKEFKREFGPPGSPMQGPPQ